MLFECHITCPLKYKEWCEKIAKATKWKTSEIERDPVLGKDSFFYLTTHSDDYMVLYNRMKRTVEYLNQVDNIVIREKIELIMYDTKVKV